MWIKKTVIERNEGGGESDQQGLLRVKTFLEVTWEERTSQKVTENWKDALKT